MLHSESSQPSAVLNPKQEILYWLSSAKNMYLDFKNIMLCVTIIGHVHIARSGLKYIWLKPFQFFSVQAILFGLSFFPISGSQF